MTNEIDKLKALAVKHYETDGGEMLESFGESDYADLIEYAGNAKAAWALHLRITKARREVGGFHEEF